MVNFIGILEFLFFHSLILEVFEVDSKFNLKELTSYLNIIYLGDLKNKQLGIIIYL